MSQLFISYSTKDRKVAELVFEKLVEMGHQPPFLDDNPVSGISAGSKWEHVLYRKVKMSRALIVLCSRNWLDSKWCFAELAYAKAMGKEFFPIQIDDCDDLPTMISERQSIKLADHDVWDRLRLGLIRAKVGPENDFPWPVAGHDECPYPGLASFESHHAGVYFGREKEIGNLRDKLNQMVENGHPRMLYVVGASGSGKSSLVKAGLLPVLDQKKSNRWFIPETFRWNNLLRYGRSWSEQLAISLLKEWPKDAPKRPHRESLEKLFWVKAVPPGVVPNTQQIKEYETSIRRAAKCFIRQTKLLLDARNRSNTTPILVIDQFEEILTSKDANDVKAFLDFIGQLFSSRHSPWRCIATVRTDFLSAIQSKSELLAWQENTDIYSLSLMKPERFSEVIRRPAEKVSLTFESDVLVDRIVNETGTNDALPLLSFALRELYQKAGADKRITEVLYEAIGGIEGCLAKVANGLFRAESDMNQVDQREHQRQVNRVFSKYLVQINDDDQFVRKAALWSELPTSSHPLLRKLIDRRLITSRPRDETDPHSERVIEVAHEALFRKWDTLVDWLNERRELLRWRSEIERDQKFDGGKWKAITEKQFAISKDWPTKWREELSRSEKDWIRKARNRIRWRRVFAGLALLFFAMIAAIAFRMSVVALNKQKETAQLAAAAFMKSASDANKTGNLGEAAFNYWQAAKLLEEDDPRNESALKLMAGTLSRAGDGLVHDHPIIDVATSNDGQRIATTCSSGEVFIWDRKSKASITTKQKVGNFPNLVEFSSDDAVVMVRGSNEQSSHDPVSVFDARTGELMNKLPGDSGWTNAEPSLILELLKHGNGTALYSARFRDTADGSSSDGALAVVDALGVKENLICAATFGENGYAVSEDGSLVATLTPSKTIYLIDLDRWKVEGPYPIGLDEANVVLHAIDSSRKAIYVSVSDYENERTRIHLVDVKTGDITSTWDLANTTAARAVFPGKGCAIVSVSRYNRGFDLFKFSSGTALSLSQDLVPEDSLNFQTAGTNRIAVIGKTGDNRVSLINSDNGKTLGRFFQHPTEITSLAIHPSFQWCVTGCADGIARVWDFPFIMAPHSTKNLAKEPSVQVNWGWRTYSKQPVFQEDRESAVVRHRILSVREGKNQETTFDIPPSSILPPAPLIVTDDTAIYHSQSASDETHADIHVCDLRSGKVQTWPTLDFKPLVAEIIPTKPEALLALADREGEIRFYLNWKTKGRRVGSVSVTPSTPSNVASTTLNYVTASKMLAVGSDESIKMLRIDSESIGKSEIVRDFPVIGSPRRIVKNDSHQEMFVVTMELIPSFQKSFVGYHLSRIDVATGDTAMRSFERMATIELLGANSDMTAALVMLEGDAAEIVELDASTLDTVQRFYADGPLSIGGNKVYSVWPDQPPTLVHTFSTTPTMTVEETEKQLVWKTGLSLTQGGSIKPLSRAEWIDIIVPVDSKDEHSR